MPRIINLSVFLFVLLFCNFSFAQKQISYYVSVDGKDTYKGTLEKPFATIQKARDVIRAKKKSNQNYSYVVFIRKGYYFLKNSFILDSVDAGTQENPISYVAYQNEEVHFTGGISIPVSKVYPVKDPKILLRLDASVREKIVQVNLFASGIKDYGKIQPKGFGRAYTVSAMELFCNHQDMKIARWPNDSLVPIGKILDAGSIPRNNDFTHRGGMFTYKTTRPSRWVQADDFWISGFFKYGYADDAVKVARLDTVNKTITTAQETMYGFESGKIFQRWYAFNLLEEIDKPGEYYIDRRAGILYFYPLAEKLETLELSSSEDPLVMMLNTSFVQFRKIIFECSRGMGIYIEKGKANVVDSCTFRNLGMMAVSIGKGIEAFKDFKLMGTGTPASGMVGNLYGHLYNNTTFNREAGTDHIINNCSIYNTGSGGIILGGGNRITLEKGNNQVYNCSISNFNRIERSYKAGINIDGVGNIIRNCEIFNCPGSAILLHGNDHLIEFNNIHHAVTDGDDMGAVYYGRDPSEFGNKIQYNFFHHIGNKHGSIMAVYHDDGACGMEVNGNVFYKAGNPTIMIGGGNDNVYTNNIFIDCPIAFHLDNRLMGWAKSNLDKVGIFETRLASVDYQQPPYAVAYPKLIHYFDDSPGVPKRNFIDNNVFINVKIRVLKMLQT